MITYMYGDIEGGSVRIRIGESHFEEHQLPVGRVDGTALSHQLTHHLLQHMRFLRFADVLQPRELRFPMLRK